MNYWIMKTEPDEFSIDDLKNAPKKRSSWEGVRNYQARNFIRDDMKKDDQVLIYHSSCKNIGIAGLARVSKAAYPDQSAQDKKSPYYDPKASPEDPRWYVVDVEWKQSFKEILSLKDIKEVKSLSDMKLLQKGNRLSVMPITKREFDIIMKNIS